MDNIQKDKLNSLKKEDEVRKIIERLEDLQLAEYYTAEEMEAGCLIGSESDFVEFLKSNKIIKFSYNEANDLYYTLGDKDESVLFDIDVEKNFKISDIWLSSKLFKVASVFPNYSSLKISKEMIYFYICLNVAGVLSGAFKTEILDFIINYDLNRWKHKLVLEQEANEENFNFDDQEVLSFEGLAKSWLETGSQVIKMIFSASKFSLLNEKKSIIVQLNDKLPQEVASSLGRLNREVDEIRSKYDRTLLSEKSKSSMSKLEIRNVVFELDTEIDQKLKEDPKLYQLYRLNNLSSRNLQPGELLRINSEARKHALTRFKEVYGKQAKEPDELLELKKILIFYKKELKRACVNKLRNSEIEKYLKSPDTYRSPDFT